MPLNSKTQKAGLDHFEFISYVKTLKLSAFYCSIVRKDHAFSLKRESLPSAGDN